jgi:hypothetical protein
VEGVYIGKGVCLPFGSKTASAGRWMLGSSVFRRPREGSHHGLNIVVRVIPKDGYCSDYLDDIFNLLIVEQKANIAYMIRRH